MHQATRGTVRYNSTRSWPPDWIELYKPLLTYSMEQSPSWEANRFSARQGIARNLWNPKLITAYTIASHLSLFWATSIQSMPPQPNSWRSILILSSHLRLGLPSGLFPSHFPTRTLYTPLLSPIRATCSVRLIFFFPFDYLNNTGWIQTINIQSIRIYNTDMRRLTTGIRSGKCVVRRFRRCANVYLHTNPDSTV